MINFLRKLNALMVLIMPPLRYYHFPFTSESMSILIVGIFLFEFIIVLYKLLSGNLRFRRESWFFIIFFIWAIFISTVRYTTAPYADNISKQTLNNFVMLIFSLPVTAMAFWDTFDFDFMVIIYKSISIFACVILLLQICCYYLLGIVITNGQVPFLNLTEIYARDLMNFGVYDSMTGFMRFSSFFAEPSHFSQYISLYLCMLLFGFSDYVKKNINWAIVISLLTLLQGSGTGIMVVAFLWLMYFLFGIKGGLLKKILVLFIGVLILVGIIIVMYNYFPVVRGMLERLFIPSSTVSTSKADYRIYRGFAIWWRLPTTYQIFGAGYKSIYATTTYFNINVKYDSHSNVQAVIEYVNDIALILINFGLLGLTLFVMFFAYVFIKGNKLAKLMICCCFTLFISDAVFLINIWSVYILITASVFYKKEAKSFWKRSFISTPITEHFKKQQVELKLK